MGTPTRPGRRPRIGLTTYWQEASWGVWNNTAAIVPGKYVTGVVAAGGTPVLLPPVGTDPAVLEVLDGLIVVGGADVDPANYGAAPHPLTRSQTDRDRHDLELTRAALDSGVPLFAICRGAQILNVALGGTLHQHVPDLAAGSNYQPAPGVFGTVEFATLSGSLTAEVLGKRASAPCYHHQSIDSLAEGLRATAWASDGTIEAVECVSAVGWALGVQFHPEENPDDPRLFEAFVDVARNRIQQFEVNHA
ncbi:gamma-glutamyl-gamma-aminobutyrate hydrolase family protein [Arthrobacter sp. KK5.5]|uniref:gamma-glutamyl-gamma-aminobutyrate hydrolase family protein n=1 Tax=Arthrobacter sp. KK5.5 TaxID=3373084 RepID=UPI003EE4E226